MILKMRCSICISNDGINPVAKIDPQSPIYGMPVLDAEKCKSVFLLKEVCRWICRN